METMSGEMLQLKVAISDVAVSRWAMMVAAHSCQAQMARRC